MVKLRISAVLSIALILFSCSEPRKADELNEPNSHDWKKLPENSFGWHETQIDGGIKLEQAERCWPIKKGWDCIRIFIHGDVSTIGSAALNPTRYHKSEYDDPALTVSTVSGGYGCWESSENHQSFFTEWISNSDDQLISNSVLSDARDLTAPWDKAYVTNFIAENKIEDNFKYFDCFYVTELARENSIATLLTSALTYDEFNGSSLDAMMDVAPDDWVSPSNENELYDPEH